MFGRWPLVEFKSLAPEVQQAFWQESSSDKAGLKKAVEKTLVHAMVESRLAREEGPFLPLSVWAKKGFDIQEIEKKANCEIHPVLGKTYQVKIHSTGHEKKEELVQNEMMKLLSCKSELGTENNKKRTRPELGTENNNKKDPPRAWHGEQ